MFYNFNVIYNLKSKIVNFYFLIIESFFQE